MHNAKLKKWFYFSAIFFLLQGCQYPSSLPPIEAALPDQYDEQPLAQRETLLWQEFFTDPALRQIIELSLRSNRDLVAATLRIREAQALYGIQRADLFPTVDGIGQWERTRVPHDLSYTGQSMVSNHYLVGVGLSSWELDLWGRIRSMKEAALQQFFAMQANQFAVRNSLIMQVAFSYITLAELEKRIDLAEKAVLSYQNSVVIFKRQYEVGANSKMAYTQAQTLLTNAQSLLAQLHQAKEMQGNLLMQLVGQKVTIPTPDIDQIQFKNEQIQVGLPSDLLLNRPDIQVAESQLRAASANIAAARAAFFPRIALTASYGLASAELDDLFKSGNRSSWTFAPSISVPLFNAGRLRSNVNLTEVRSEIAVADYEKTIQYAFREVADALAQKKWLQQQLNIQSQGLKAFRERARLAQLSYDNGAVTYLEVLDAQRSLLSAEQQWVETHSALLKAQVALYVALGGDASLVRAVVEQEDEA